jgi:hypothetical protein
MSLAGCLATNDHVRHPGELTTKLAEWVADPDASSFDAIAMIFACPASRPLRWLQQKPGGAATSLPSVFGSVRGLHDKLDEYVVDAIARNDDGAPDPDLATLTVKHLYADGATLEARRAFFTKVYRVGGMARARPPPQGGINDNRPSNNQNEATKVRRKHKICSAVTKWTAPTRGGRPSLGKAGAASGHAIRSPCVKIRSKTAVLLASSIKSSAVRCALAPDPL